LVLGRENRAPIDLVLAVGDDEPDGVGTSTDEYVQELIDRQRKAHDLTRQHLGEAAQRRKREYDVRVKSRQFKTGDWVWYYYPRRYKGRSPKWSKTYTGPYLVVREIPPCNFVLQKSQRSQPFVTHTDKLKMCLGDTPRSWLPVEGETCENPRSARSNDGDRDDETIENNEPARDSAGLNEFVLSEDPGNGPQSPVPGASPDDVHHSNSPRGRFS